MISSYWIAVFLILTVHHCITCKAQTQLDALDDNDDVFTKPVPPTVSPGAIQTPLPTPVPIAEPPAPPDATYPQFDGTDSCKIANDLYAVSMSNHSRVQLGFPFIQISNI